jgi:hypothetical protein
VALAKLEKILNWGLGLQPLVEVSAPIKPDHVAFRATNRIQVRSFYEAAIAAGGRSNGEPGLCPEYHSDYYAAFVFDPDGLNIEAVCHLDDVDG